ncbi:AAA family ATPase [Candidatus Saccharibacteria bacterium]|nr:AAA family ATPase [Candidatus Saccharibacteria bacterium]
MEGNKTKPRLLLVFGAPCSGKTTFAEKFAKKYNLAYYNLDELADEDKFSRENILRILDLISRTHANIIIEGGIGTEKDRTEIRNVFRAAGYEPALIWVQTDLATIRTRLRIRHKTIAKAKKILDSAESLEAPAEYEAPIILSGKHTFETQSKHTLAGLADAVKR